MMLLGGITRGHSHYELVTFGEGYVLVGEVVVRLHECLGKDVHEAPTEHKSKEALGCLV